MSTLHVKCFCKHGFSNIFRCVILRHCVLLDRHVARKRILRHFIYYYFFLIWQRLGCCILESGIMEGMLLNPVCGGVTLCLCIISELSHFQSHASLLCTLVLIVLGSGLFWDVSRNIPEHKWTLFYLYDATRISLCFIILPLTSYFQTFVKMFFLLKTHLLFF